MKNFKFKIKNVKLAFVILIIALFVVFLLYYHFVFAESFARNDFANQMVEISEANEKSVFNVQKVLLYSSANAIDNSESQALQNMSICQYTDISIYIDNMANASELTDENTIKQLYIDNINISATVIYYFEAPVTKNSIIGNLKVMIGDEVIEILNIYNVNEIRKMEMQDYLIEFLEILSKINIFSL